MPLVPLAQRLVAPAAVAGGLALVGLAAGGVEAVDARLEEAATRPAPVVCDVRVSARPEDRGRAAEPCPPLLPVTRDDVEL